jgi:2-polyprenyl-3-methyl-5-hydroxy-6-metoxy-1,4-benzoquinol methylase
MNTQAHWEGVYRESAVTEVSWYQTDPARSLEWILSVAPDRDSAILDVGAGASLLVDRLLDDGYNNVGVLDLAASALAEVRARLGDRAAGVHWFTGDVLDFRSPHLFDVWHDRAVLHFLTEPHQQLRYADVLRQTLAPGGYALISTFAIGGPTRCSGLDVMQYDCSSMGDLLGEEFSCVQQETEIHRTPAGGEQLFQYCLFRRSGGDT